MFKFDIYTDSSCDLPNEMVEQYDIKVLQLEVNIDNHPPVYNKDVDAKEFYDKLRAGANAKTNAVTPGYVEDHMRASLTEGRDILYLGFSSALSVTYNNSVMIINELQEEFPERTLLHIDTLCASLGQGLLVHYAALKREEGIDIRTLYEELAGVKDRIHHEFTVDDLFFLKRGGRISATTAVLGSVLHIKPIMHVSPEGKLEAVGKVRGRKLALKELVSKLASRIAVDEWKHVFISHGDCYEEACYGRSCTQY